MVGLQLARSGRMGQARQMMQEIAPVGVRGFAPAHAWLAIDLLTRPERTKEERNELVNHLRLATAWEGLSSRLLAIYANLMAGEGSRSDALAAMERAARQDPVYLGALAVMAKQFNSPKTAADSSARAKTLISQKLEAGDATADDYLQLMKVQLADEEFQAAFETGRMGLAKTGDNDALKYWCSEALRMLFRKSIRKSDRGVEMNLALLDAAIKEFPSNPFLAEDIAMLTDMGVEASPQLKSVLESQLAKGQATAVAHLILANQEIKADRLKQAIPHLELALKLAPTHPVTLNNLALALALTDKKQLERAEELIEKALSINPGNAEFYDSQGEIRLIAERPLDAIESLEKAIGIDPSRRHTHELMVTAYRDAGLEDLAQVHEKFLAENAAEPKESAAAATTDPATGAEEDSAAVEKQSPASQSVTEEAAESP
jgi:tetratricopeptide (TPR) repeat protein